MKLEYQSRMKMLRGFAVLADLFLLNVGLLVAKKLGIAFSDARAVDPALAFFGWNFAYIVCAAFLPPTIGRRAMQSNDIARNCFRAGLVMVALHYALLAVLTDLAWPSPLRLVLICMVVPVWMFCSRLLSRTIVRAFSSSRRVVFVGASLTLADLVDSMRTDLTSRYEMLGVFAAEDVHALPRLGSPEAAFTWLEAHACDEVYCATGALDAVTLRKLFDYCENHLIRFYGVPDSRRMLDMRMVVELDGDIPIFTPRLEPLHRVWNRIVKRLFDIVFSSLVLTLLFPWVFLFVAYKIKRSSPGPIFFTQWRDGLDGRRFKCI